MSAFVKVGNFDNGSTGNVSVTGLTFRPRAVMIVTIATATVGAFVSQAIQSTGISDGTNHYCAWATWYNANQRKGQRSKILYAEDDSGTTIIDTSAFTLNADGFTINFTTCAATYKFLWIAFGGTIATKAIAQAGKIATGNQNYTGVGFRPDTIIAIGNYSDLSTSYVADGFVGFGVAGRRESGTASSKATSSIVNTGGTVSKRNFSSSSSVLMDLRVPGTLYWVSSLNNMLSDGWSAYEYAAVPSTLYGLFLCIKGIGADVNVITEDAATGVKTYTVNTQRRVLGVLTSGIAHTASVTDYANASISFGALDRSSSPAQWCINMAKTDGAAGFGQSVQYVTGCMNAHEISSSEAVHSITSTGTWNLTGQFVLNRTFGAVTANQYFAAVLIDMTQPAISMGGD